MPKDYSNIPPNKQRRAQNARHDAWIIQFLHQAEVGYVATRWEEQPFLTPTSFWFDEPHHRIIFHSNVVGRLRANIDRHPQVCFAVHRQGSFLPSNVALEFSVQYASVIVFGQAHLLDGPDDQRRALYGLIAKYFPGMTPGLEFRPITDQELNRTSIYTIEIETWSGKENWPAEAEQSPEWPALKSTTTR